MNTLYVSWTSPDRTWYPVGRLDAGEGRFIFRYIQGAHDAARKHGFESFLSFPDLGRAYISETLFPMFQNRLMPASRPDYKDHLDELALSVDQAEPMVILARSGGRRVTDTLRLFARPEQDTNGMFNADFFLHVPPASDQEISTLRENDRLRLCHDIQNPVGTNAILLYTTHNMSIVGFVPHYMNTDLLAILKHDSYALEAVVVKVNSHPAPSWRRLLCRTTAPWPEDFEPYSADDYNPLIRLDSVSGGTHAS